MLLGLGQRMQLVREQQGLTKKEVAERLGITQSSVNQWEKGRNYPSQQNLIHFSDLMSVTYNWLVHGVSGPSGEDIQIRFFEDINCSAGDGSIGGSHEAILISASLIPIPNEKLHKDVIAIKVRGDSMEPAITDGGIVFVDTSCKDLIEGKIYVYCHNDLLRIKRFEYSVSGLVIKSINPSYTDERITRQMLDGFSIVGRAIYAINQL